MSKPDIVIIGLGNPGKKYQDTRHNLGFMVIEEFAKIYGFSKFSSLKYAKADMAEGKIGDKSIALIKSMTMMNSSGEAVGAILKYYNLVPSKTWVVYDDAHLFFGHVRTRSNNHTAGGHNGIKSIIEHIGANFLRVRIGIANKHLIEAEMDKFVLANFSTDERAKLQDLIIYCANLLDGYIENGFEDQTLKTL